MPQREVNESELPGEELEDDVDEPQDDDAAAKLATDDRQLALQDAEDFAGAGTLDVVLIVGEIETGKTTLLVAIWDIFMTAGQLGSTRFAGSRTALGFERRAWLSRLASGGERRSTLRTYQADNGFLHLRVAATDTTHELLLSDVAGETFREVREGMPLDGKIEWLARVDAVLVLVDGASIADGAKRSTALSNTRTLLKQLAAAKETARVGVVLTMADLVTSDVRTRWDDAYPTLLEIARTVDACAATFEIAARRDDGGSPTGLDDLMAWLVAEQPVPEPVATTENRATRVSGRAR